MPAHIPAIFFPPELPVSQLREEIAATIAANQVVIVAGATGSGKTTQLPKICLELGRTSIGHTQPRRLAARTIAERIAEELEVELGELVGYQVRFTDRVGKDTRIKLMTDGILLNEMQRDRLLSRYDTLIIDEAHERSLNIDFLLGYLKQLLPKRPDLKLIITSATIDPQSFARHFASADGSPAPIVEVSGRTYPVEIRYRPLVQDVPLDEDDGPDAGTASPARTGTAKPAPAKPAPDRDLFEGITAALAELSGEAPGDVLVFLSGENEIRDAEDAIRGLVAASPSGSLLGSTEVLPLYGRLSSAEQHRVFEPGRAAGTRRRVILATNVAETSLTVPGIKYVIDGGTARISRYSTRSKVQRLPIEPISQASANQRAGRSGRTSDGIAIRLYSEEDYEKRPAYTEPEILRTNLAAVILQMISLDLGDVVDFPFLQPPDSRGVKDGLDLLRELGALKREGTLTRTGRDLARLPIDPRLGRMVIESKRHGVSREVLVIVAALSIQDPRERPLEKRQQADGMHARFTDPKSDFLSLVNLWNYLEEKQRELSSSAFRRLCKAEFLNFLRVREWQDVFRQLRRLASSLELTIGDAAVNPDGIHRSLLAGLLSQIGVLDARTASSRPKGAAGSGGQGGGRPSGEYLGARQVRFALFPGSALAKKPPAAVMGAELVETSRLFARTNAGVDLAWAEQIAGDLVRRSYGEPHWEKRQGSAVAYERVTLYGVPLVERRRVQFAKIDPAYARELFLRHALVEGDWPADISRDRLYDFVRANAALRAELLELEERTRRRNILFDDESLFEFYQRRVPADVNSVRSFESWWRVRQIEDPALLTMSADDLAEDLTEAAVDERAFPPTWTHADQVLNLSYRFEPGAEDDGVTVRVPLPLLAELSPAGFDWQVPGFREELVVALLRTLPKSIRRNVVPAAEWARRLLDALPDGADLAELTLAEFLAREIRRQTHTPVDPTDFELDRLPAHLRVTFAVVDESGSPLARSSDLAALQHKLQTRARESVARVFSPKARAPGPQAGGPRPTPGVGGAGGGLERSGLVRWDFDELPRQLDVRQAGSVIRAYPALIDEGDSVAIRLMGTSADQATALRAGVRRLLALSLPSPFSYVEQHLTGIEKLSLAASPYRSTRALFDDALSVCVDAAVRRDSPDGLVFDRAQFEGIRDRLSSTLLDDLFALMSLVARILQAAREVDRSLKQAAHLALLPALTDAHAQLAALVFDGFVAVTGADRLRRLPAYLAGIQHRIDKLAENPGRDRVWMNEVQTATERYLAAGGTLPIAREAPAHLARGRWLLEELRLSLFAQHLPTTEPVSLQRITRALAG